MSAASYSQQLKDIHTRTLSNKNTLKGMVADTGFVLVGAGLPRTGTLSTKVALEKLLKGNIYHGINLFKLPEHRPFWWKALHGHATKEGYQETLADFRGGVDYPVARFYKDILAAHPEAKVLLNVRDPTAWYVSVRDSILKYVRTLERWPVTWFTALTGLSDAGAIGLAICENQPPWSSSGLGMFGAVEAGREAAIRFYNDHVNEVKAHVPADRLLVWQVKEGWAPLCKFLDRPIPKEPFPRVNDTAQIETNRKIILTMSWLAVVVVPAGMALAAYHLKITDQPIHCMLMVGGYFLMTGLLKVALHYSLNNSEN